MIVVLAGLAILAALFAVTSTTAVTQGLHQRADLLLLQRSGGRINQLDRVLGAGPDEAFSLDGLQLVDVGGYIDLNTGDPRLIKLLLDALGLPPSSHQLYIDWRRTPRRFLRLEDFLRVTSARPDQLYKLNLLATVHSGRRGIDPENAPLPVLELVTSASAGTRERLISLVPPDLVSAPSGINFRVWVTDESGMARPTGLVHLAKPPDQRHILWIN